MQNRSITKPQDEIQVFIHDLSSPLSNLGLNLESLRDQLKNMPANYEQSISSALRSLNFINDYVLSYSKPIKANHPWFNIRNEIDYLISNHFNTTFNELDIEFRIDSSGTNIIHGSKFDFRRLIFNLLNNSCEAFRSFPTSANRIRISISSDTNSITLKVIDNGPGIANCKDIFNYGNTTKTGHLGIGLGLVSQIVDKFGGEIEVTSQPYQSTCFKIQLPQSSN